MDTPVFCFVLSLEGYSPGSLLLLGFAVPTNAEDALAKLRETSDRGLMLSTEPERWSILFANALRLRFRSTERGGSDPRNSTMESLEFFFQSRYEGDELPVLAEPAQ
jgi:hypothetical protein